MAASISAVESIIRLCPCQGYHPRYCLFAQLPTGQNKTPGATLCSQLHLHGRTSEESGGPEVEMRLLLGNGRILFSV